jgi:outer membrane protein assembly factor BamE (lipoprotein component of BamABCDE complex)
MTAIFRTALLATLAVAFIPAAAAAQDASPAALLRRIESLERANNDLERRVRELEATIKNAPSKGKPVVKSTKWKDLANWRQLHVGMSMDEVRELLGEPEHVEGGHFTTWHWGDAEVEFTSDKVSSWTEPKR